MRCAFHNTGCIAVLELPITESDFEFPQTALQYGRTVGIIHLREAGRAAALQEENLAQPVNGTPHISVR